MNRRHALLIGCSEFSDRLLTRLRTPAADVDELAGVLASPKIGAFDEVVPLHDPDCSSARRAIARLFSGKSPDDVLLLFFSGHGVRDENGDLFLAVRDTEHDLLNATGVPASFISAEMDRSRSKRQVLILDCCHSGAFVGGMKAVASAPVHAGVAFRGSGFGRVILTASDSTQYAWEGDNVTGQSTNSVFTRCLIQGLRTGEADLDADGEIEIDELYTYVFTRVRELTPLQTPGKTTYRQEGKIYLARNLTPVIKPEPLPADIVEQIESHLAAVREAAVAELSRIVQGSNRGRALSARQSLEKLRDDDSRRVGAAASAALASAPQPEVDPTETVNLPQIRPSPAMPRPPKPMRNESAPLVTSEPVRPAVTTPAAPPELVIARRPMWRALIISLLLLPVTMGFSLPGVLAAIFMLRGAVGAFHVARVWALILEAAGLAVAVFVVGLCTIDSVSTYDAEVWMFIGFAGLACFAGNVAIAAGLSRPEVSRRFGLENQTQTIPWMLAVPLLLTLVGSVAALGLLLRKAWAPRLARKVLIALGIAVPIIVIACGFEMRVHSYIDSGYYYYPNEEGLVLAFAAAVVGALYAVAGIIHLRRLFRENATEPRSAEAP